MTPLRTALYQGPAGLAAFDSVAARAAARGARLLVTPELSLTGYALGDRVHELAEPADGPGAEAVSAVAARHNIAIAYGFPERDGPHVFNSAQLTGPDGTRLALYRKTHLYGGYETDNFTAGDRLVVQAELHGLRVGLLVCYDVEFPEAVRAHALAGTELLLVPTALMRPYDFVPERLVPARAWENQMFVAYANRTGPEGEFDFAGLSCLAAPDGTEPARAGREEELLVAEADPSVIAAARAGNPYLTDRRPDLYDSAIRIGKAPSGPRSAAWTAGMR